MINSIHDIKNFIGDKSFKRIFLLCGKKSFVNSGAERFFNELIKKKELKIFYKKSKLPRLEELLEIVEQIKKFKPD